MEQLPFEISQIIDGSQPNLQSAGPGNDHGFETVLKGILGSTNNKTVVAKGMTGKSGLESNDVNLQKLATLIDKLSKILTEKNESGQGVNIQEILQQEFSEEEISLLQNFLLKNISIEELQNGFDFTIENGEEIKSALQTIENSISLLNKVIENISSRQDGGVMLKEGGEGTPLQVLTALKSKLEEIQAGFKAVVKQKTEPLNNGKTEPLNNGKTEPHNSGKTEPLQTTAPSETSKTLPHDQKPLQNQAGKNLSAQKTLSQISGESIFQKQGAENKENTGLGFSANNNLKKGLTGVNQQVAHENMKQEKLTQFFQYMSQTGKESDEKTFVKFGNVQQVKHESLDNLFEKLNASAKTVTKGAGGLSSDTSTFDQKNPGDGKGGDTTRSLLFQNLLKGNNTVQTFTQTAKGELFTPPSTKTNVNSAYLLEQLSEKMNLGIRQGESRISIQLNPPSLGKLQIELAMNQNQLRAVIIAESVQVKQALEANLTQLKACLENNNIDVEKVSVSLGNGNNDNQFASFLREQRSKGKKGNFSQGAGFEPGQGISGSKTNPMLMNPMISTRESLDLFA